ncbi:MAG: hypothetical protein AAFW00_09900 [Bacteroidota bacterium]
MVSRLYRQLYLFLFCRFEQVAAGLRLPQDSGSLYLKATAGTGFEAETTLVQGASYPDELLI